MAENAKKQKSDVPRSRHRSLTERVVVTGMLELVTPAHFGNGDADDATDLPLLLDETDGRALLTGASLAGALRNYLREWEQGYEQRGEGMTAQLFGSARAEATNARDNEPGDQSPLIVDDALSLTSIHPLIELRDGVALDATTRTAVDGKKYDFELLAAGTKFALRFELLLDQGSQHQERLRALALALAGLSKGEIRLGARKRRGFGACEVKQWTVTRFQFRQAEELLTWLVSEHKTLSDKLLAAQPERAHSQPQPKHGPDIAGLLGVSLDELHQVPDQRQSFEIEARFAVDGSLLVRSGFDEQDCGPDTVHLQTHNPRTGKPQAVLPGTSLAGALRQRAQRIAHTLAGADQQKGVQAFINEMFGPHEIKDGKQARASRIVVNEEFVEGGQSLVQTRIKIDRFTQGTIEAALLEEAPHFGGQVKLKLKLLLIPHDRNEAEIGLLLLVLKDLWLGDLPLGGASSIGRGRLRGQTATLRWHTLSKPPLAVTVTAQEAGALAFDDATAADKLEHCVKQLQQVAWAALAQEEEEQS